MRGNILLNETEVVEVMFLFPNTTAVNHFSPIGLEFGRFCYIFSFCRFCNDILMVIRSSMLSKHFANFYCIFLAYNIYWLYGEYDYDFTYSCAEFHFGNEIGNCFPLHQSWDLPWISFLQCEKNHEREEEQVVKLQIYSL